jgi:DNA-binding NarL/FixJ family response regulator
MQTESSQALSNDLERKIVRLVTQGYRNREIAEKLCLSERTLNEHIGVIYDTFDVSDRLELILYGIIHGFVAPAASEMMMDAKAWDAPVVAHAE